ncbi:MAG TPA: hypothetical protein VGI92_00650, partial [Gemmatimonadales bacterium]
MAIPMILYVGAATQAIPIGAVFAVGGWRPPPTYRKIALWCLLLIMGDLIGYVAAKLFQDNLWVNYFMQPAEAAMTLWILASW